MVRKNVGVAVGPTHSEIRGRVVAIDVSDRAPQGCSRAWVKNARGVEIVTSETISGLSVLEVAFSTGNELVCQVDGASKRIVYVKLEQP
jgi:hypothetical protein